MRIRSLAVPSRRNALIRGRFGRFARRFRTGSGLSVRRGFESLPLRVVRRDFGDSRRIAGVSKSVRAWSVGSTRTNRVALFLMSPRELAHRRRRAIVFIRAPRCG
jgi:hypothetical protein